jgi:hypothetical protein
MPKTGKGTPARPQDMHRELKPGGLVSPADYAKISHQRVIDAVGGNVI